MGFEVMELADGVMSVRITGELKKAEADQIQAQAIEAIRQWGKLRLLFTLEDFRGWERGVDWGDTSFALEYGDAVQKMAIVGDESWRDLVYAFLGKGLRSTLIEYFSVEERGRAQAWLEED